MIEVLITGDDYFQKICDKLGDILKTESVSQMAKAVTADEDPTEWKLRVFTRRSNPWAEFQKTRTDGDEREMDRTPIVNVFFEGMEPDMASSNRGSRQTYKEKFNIDIYGYGIAADKWGDGHIAGDSKAISEMERALKLVRRILSSPIYKDLDLPIGQAWDRWPDSIQTFVPADLDGRPVANVMACRISLSVNANEFSPEYVAQNLEEVEVKATRDPETAELIFDEIVSTIPTP